MPRCEVGFGVVPSTISLSPDGGSRRLPGQRFIRAHIAIPVWQVQDSNLESLVRRRFYRPLVLVARATCHGVTSGLEPAASGTTTRRSAN
jgi:hypothetical protein